MSRPIVSETCILYVALVDNVYKSVASLITAIVMISFVIILNNYYFLLLNE